MARRSEFFRVPRASMSVGFKGGSPAVVIDFSLSIGPCQTPCILRSIVRTSTWPVVSGVSE